MKLSTLACVLFSLSVCFMACRGGTVSHTTQGGATTDNRIVKTYIEIIYPDPQSAAMADQLPGDTVYVKHFDCQGRLTEELSYPEVKGTPTRMERKTYIYSPEGTLQEIRIHDVEGEVYARTRIAYSEGQETRTTYQTSGHSEQVALICISQFSASGDTVSTTYTAAGEFLSKTIRRYDEIGLKEELSYSRYKEEPMRKVRINDDRQTRIWHEYPDSADEKVYFLTTEVYNPNNQLVEKVSEIPIVNSLVGVREYSYENGRLTGIVDYDSYRKIERLIKCYYEYW